MAKNYIIIRYLKPNKPIKVTLTKFISYVYGTEVRISYSGYT